MSCDEVREQLEGFIVDATGVDADEIAAHLRSCRDCADEERALRRLIVDLQITGQSFRPRLLPPEPVLISAAADARRRTRTLLVAACLGVLVAVTVAAVWVPALARRLPLPVGRQLQALQQENEKLKDSLARSVGEARRLVAELDATERTRGTALLPEVRRHVQQRSKLVKSIVTFFGAQAAATLPSARGDAARQSLAEVTVPGSQAARTTHYYSLGVQRSSQPATRLSRGDALVLVTGLQLLSGGRAVAFVRPLDYAWLARVEGSQTSVGVKAGRDVWSHYVHEVVLTEDAIGQWKVAKDGSLDPAIVNALRAGGAPDALVQKMAAVGAPRMLADALVPPGALKTIDGLLGLLNAGRWTDTAALFADGKGIDQKGLDPYWIRSGASPELKLNGIGLMLYCDSARPGPASHLYVQVGVDSPDAATHPLLTGGRGMPGFWEMERANDGTWLIVAMNDSP